jgi:conjugative transposon TraN protein
MKTYKRFLSLTLLALMALSSWAQSPTSHLLTITDNKTSSIIFPADIRNVDRGSRDVMAQKATGVENVLQLKAARQNFPETNLTVITADGTLHHFMVTYARQPEKLLMRLDTIRGIENPIRFDDDFNHTEMREIAEDLITKKRSIRFRSTHQYKITLSLFGIYVHGNTIYYHLQLKNLSNINYDVEYLRFYIRDKSRVKRTASQEIQIKPLFVHGNSQTIPGQSINDAVFALEKFTIPDAKHLSIEMFEKNGGRNLNLNIDNSTILKARTLPSKSTGH